MSEASRKFGRLCDKREFMWAPAARLPPPRREQHALRAARSALARRRTRKTGLLPSHGEQHPTYLSPRNIAADLPTLISILLKNRRLVCLLAQNVHEIVPVLIRKPVPDYHRGSLEIR